MSNRNRYYESSRGSRDHGGYSGHWTAPHISQHAFPQEGYYEPNGYQNWSQYPEEDYGGNWSSDYWHSDYTNQQSNWDRTYDVQGVQPSYSNNWRQPPQRSSRSRGRTYRNRQSSGSYPQPNKRIKVEVPNNSDSQASNNQNLQNQTSSTSDHANEQNFRTLTQQVKTEEPYWRSGHHIQDVLWVPHSSDKQSIPSMLHPIETVKLEDNIVVNNSNAELGGNPNQSVLIDRTNHNDAVHHEKSSQINLHNKENTSVHSIALETNNTQEVSQNKSSAASTVNASSLTVPKLTLWKSNNKREWSVQSPTISNRVSSDATDPRTDVTVNSSIIQNSNLESNCSNQLVLSVSSNSTEKTIDPASYQLPQNQLSKQHESTSLPTSVVTASFLATINDIYSEDECFHDDSNRCLSPEAPSVNSIFAVFGDSDDEGIEGAFSQDSSNECIDPCAATVAASTDTGPVAEASADESDTDESESSDASEDSSDECIDPSAATVAASTDAGPVADASTDESESSDASEDSSDECIDSCAATVAASTDAGPVAEASGHESDSSYDSSEECIQPATVAVNADANLISEGSADESDPEERKESDSPENDSISISSEESNLACKRRAQDDELFTPDLKKPKIVFFGTVVCNTDEIIVISSDDEDEQEVVNLSHTLPISLISPVESIIVEDTPIFAKATTSNLNTSNRYKPSSPKSTKRVENKKYAVKKPVTSKSEEKAKQVISSATKKRVQEKIEQPLSASKLPSRQEGKQRQLINNKELVVLLKRLPPHEISKFSVPKNVDKSIVLYQKDVLYQIKYFISFIEYLSMKNNSIVLTTNLENPRDLCNTQLYYSNKSECTLVEIKYLQISEHCKITYKSLSNPEFDIKKLYKSFLDFRMNSNKKLDHFTIFTNIELNMDCFKSNRVKVKCENNRYQFSVNEGHELHKKFVNCLTLHKLAVLLVQCIEQRKQKNFNTELIRKYHLALINENVFKIDTKKNSNGRQIHFAKFHPNFLKQTALSDAARELRRYITDILSEPKPHMYFDLSDPFGKDTNLDPHPIINVIEVADVLASKEQTKLLVMKDQLKKIVGHVLEKIQDNVFGFSKQFFEGINLPGNLQKLRRQVNTWCDHRRINFKEFCRDYRISIDDFCNEYPVHRLPNENGRELFEEFFKIFNFANIQKHIRLNKEMSKINDEACLNDVQEEVLAGLRSDNLCRETFASIATSISKSKIIKSSYKPLQSKMNIEFHEDVVDAFQAKLTKHAFFLCVTKCLSLTEVIVKQLSTKLNYAADKESLFITNKVLLEMTDDVLNALSDKSTRLLVVRWDDPMKSNSKVLDVFSKLINKIGSEYANTEQFLKSVIVIINELNYSSGMDTIFSNKITDDQHSFELSKDSRVKLLQAENVSLQHRRLSLMKSNLILDEHVPIILESTEILSQLLAGKLVIGKELVKPEGYDKPFFKTQIKQCILINPVIFHEQIEDVFIIRNIERKDLEQYLPPRQKILSPNDVPASMRINARFILLGFNIPPSFFDDYAEKNPEYSVHLLRYESGSFVWEKTSGNNMDLMRNRLDDIGDLLKTQKIEDVVTEGPKTIIICGEAGAGKSVYLYKCARETKNLYKTESIDTYWPVQVNLDKVRLSKYAKKNVKMTQDYLARFLCNYLELDEVQGKLLSMIFKDQLKIKLSIFFDNYEELPSSQREFVIQLLQELQVSFCEKIYVTSTPNTRSELENALGVFAYTLEFSVVEKFEFLQKFWSVNYGDIDFTNEAGYFVDHYGKSETNDEDITTTPLHLKMLAGMHDPNDDDYTSIEAHDELYKLYVEHKGVKDEESACLYSLRKILDEDQLKALDIHKKYPKKGFSLPSGLRHRTFYEYFSAKWLGTHDHSLTNSLFVCLLDSESPLFLKTYLAERKTSDDVMKIVDDFAANGHLNHLKMMLAQCKDKLLLSTIIRSDNQNARQSIRFLLDHYNDTKDEIMQHGEFKRKKYAESNVVEYVNRREKPKKETPLEAAARMKNIPIACELLLKGADLQKIDKKFVFEIARYIANELCKTDSAWLHPIAEKLLKLQPEAVTQLDKAKKYPRLLTYFYTHGRVNLINHLLKNERERYDILVAKVDNKTPLDFVNESRVLSDDERLDITKYIVSNVGDDHERRDKYYLANVLKAAAECNHERTFEYFIGRYPNKHMGFLEHAMKSNRLDLIRFLMRTTDRMMYPDENTALHKAVSLGVSPTTIKFLINRGGIDNKNKFEETPLCVAFKEGQDFEIVEYLIKRDAHLFTKDELGLYPWCHAILEDSKYTSEEQMSIMRYLQDKVKLKAPETEQKISFDSDLKRKDVAKKLKFFQQQDFKPKNFELYIALKSNNESYIKFLILHGADVNHESEGRMPLHIAIEFKRYKLAKMLLDYGAMFNTEDKSGKTPLQLLSNNGDETKESKEIKQLLKTAKNLFEGNEKYTSQVSRHLINCRDKQGQTLLHVAAKNGNLTAIKDMIKHSKNYCIEYKHFRSLDVNAKDDKGQTPLYLVKKDNVDVAKELLINGAVFEPASTPLLQAAKKLIQAVKDKDTKKVKELVKNDCLVNARDECGRSCLHYAAISDYTEIMKIILAVAATDVDAMDSSLQTPLHYAVRNDHIACVVLLLKAGASYDLKNSQGNRPFDSTDNTNESLKLLKKIHQMFVDIKSDEPRILDNENPDALVEYLSEIERVWHVSKDVVVNVSDSKKNTLLHIAARYDFTSVVVNLLRQSAIYNSKNREKRSPESLAISTRQFFRDVSNAFNKSSVSSWTNLDPEFVVNLRANNGYTLLHNCVNYGKKEEVRWLVENGADVKTTSSRGHRIKCDKKKYPEIFQLLYKD